MGIHRLVVGAIDRWTSESTVTVTPRSIRSPAFPRTLMGSSGEGREPGVPVIALGVRDRAAAVGEAFRRGLLT